MDTDFVLLITSAFIVGSDKNSKKAKSERLCTFTKYEGEIPATVQQVHKK